MICLRCGHCCVAYMVVVVDDPENGPVPGNVVGHEGNCRCKHLVGDEPGQLSCAVHGRPWYAETPCASHGQIEQSPEDPCRMGEYVLAHPDLVRDLLRVPFRPVPLEEESP
jgi:hypothetical protein